MEGFGVLPLTLSATGEGATTAEGTGEARLTLGLVGVGRGEHLSVVNVLATLTPLGVQATATPIGIRATLAPLGGQATLTPIGIRATLTPLGGLTGTVQRVVEVDEEDEP